MGNHKKVLALIGAAGLVGLTIHKAISKEFDLDEEKKEQQEGETSNPNASAASLADQMSELLSSFLESKKETEDAHTEEDIARHKEMADKLKAEALRAEAFTETVEEAFSEVMAALEDASDKIETYIREEMTKDNGE